jgi:hypothetical protein
MFPLPPPLTHILSFPRHRIAGFAPLQQAVNKAITQLCANTQPSTANVSLTLFSNLFAAARLQGLDPENATSLVQDFMEQVRVQLESVSSTLSVRGLVMRRPCQERFAV